MKKCYSKCRRITSIRFCGMCDVCKTIHTRLHELSYELTMGYPVIIVIKNAAMFWKDVDLELQLKNRDRWDDLARKYYALDRK